MTQNSADAIQHRMDTKTWTLSGYDTRGFRLYLTFSEEKLQHSGQILIGRDSQICELVIADPTVSRQHARLTTRNNSLWIEDLKSSNGTRINGRRVIPGGERLPANSEIGIGDIELRITRQVGATPFVPENSTPEVKTPEDRVQVTPTTDTQAKHPWFFVLLIMVASVLYIKNPTESTLKEHITDKIRNEIQAKTHGENPFMEFGAGIVSALTPAIVDGAFTIRRKNYILFSKFTIEMSPLLKGLSKAFGTTGQDERICLIGVFDQFVKIECKKTS